MGRSGNRQVVFKEFTVHDDQCAMKVGTDAVLLGSWLDVSKARQIIDVGTGSGIVALMVAQRAKDARVVGVEMDLNAANQAAANFLASPFSKRLEAVTSKIQHFDSHPMEREKYDWVVSNPPFFHNKPKSPDPSRNLARHDDELPLEDMLRMAHFLLHATGMMGLVWPTDRESELIGAATEGGWKCARKLRIHGTSEHESLRFLSEWYKDVPEQAHRREESEDVMCIEEPGRRTGQPQYSTRYRELLMPFVTDESERVKRQ